MVVQENPVFGQITALRNRLKFDKDIIRIFSGLPGSGKSYHATLEILDWVQKGGQVYTNANIDFRDTFPKLNCFSVKRFDDIKDFKYFRNSLIVYDEGHIGLDSRDWKTLEHSERVLLSQLRKIGNKLIVISQDFDRVDTVVRDLTSLCVEHHRAGRLFWWSEYLPADIKRKRRKKLSLFPTFSWFDKKVADTYNCDELFGMDYEINLPFKTFPPTFFGRLSKLERDEVEKRVKELSTDEALTFD